MARAQRADSVDWRARTRRAGHDDVSNESCGRDDPHVEKKNVAMEHGHVGGGVDGAVAGGGSGPLSVAPCPVTTGRSL
jgi:hypothetical protein